MRLTRRGFAVLAGAACCYLLGELAGYTLFRAIAGIALGAVAAAVALTRFRPKVEVTRSVYPDRIERGRPALATLVVRNGTGRRHGGFAADDRVGSEVHEVAVRPLAPGAAATYHYELPTASRGRLPVGPLVLNRSDPFGLARGEARVGSTAYLWSYPRLHPVHPAREGHPRHHHDGPITDPPLRGSVDLLAVREYVIGDEVRYLHWKATARTGRLMVREYADPAQPRFTVVLDTRPAALSAEEFEEAVEVAASLLYAAAAEGQYCRLITSSGTSTPVDSGLRVARVLLDELCLVARNAAEDAPLVPASLITGARPGGALVVVTGRDTELGTASRWRPDTVIRLGGTRAASGSAGVITAGNAAEAVAKWNAVGVR
ncbi:DUF58 domain-containing protein [Amycolatopsis rhizosphaerae]|uniref:DUF58 domain-containing protein n=1 Tax=Amycolatopsis rhizosphaerae TaxID=2053003 RepID=A0A558AB98_9PSEU|nr:DUF58 domain-containing protein [Amycolatopsis rhizosphaerae]TVT21536.1 DUF58 domain-containing protein [Amycolatopsis rhizosphaerae]